MPVGVGREITQAHSVLPWKADKQLLLILGAVPIAFKEPGLIDSINSFESQATSV